MASNEVRGQGDLDSDAPRPSVSGSSLSQKAEEEKSEVERDNKPILDNEGYHRYLRLGRALLYLKEALHKPVESNITKLHRILMGKIDDKQKKPKEIIKRLKSMLQNHLNTVDESNKIYIKNVNYEKLESSPWEIAKAFMPAGQIVENTCPKETDTMGILRLISSCKQFQFWMEADGDDKNGHEKVKMVLEVRHSVAHSPTLVCSENEMENGLEQIRILLKHMKQKFDSLAKKKDASEDDKKLYQEAAENVEDALDNVDKVKIDTDFVTMGELVAQDLSKSKAYELSNETERKQIAKVHLRHETIKIFNYLHDLYKNRSKDFKERLQEEKALQPFIIEANPDNVQYLLAGLEEKEMFKAENMDDLLELIKPLQIGKDFRRLKKDMMEFKKCLKRISAIACTTVYDVFILHCEDDKDKASSFRDRHLNLDPPAKIILYDEYVLTGTSQMSALDYVLEDCRLVFILCTQAFMKDILSKFQAEIIMYTSLQRNEGPRVIPIYMEEKDKENSPRWMKTMTPICAWKFQNTIENTIKNGRKKYLSSSK